MLMAVCEAEDCVPVSLFEYQAIMSLFLGRASALLIGRMLLM